MPVPKHGGLDRRVQLFRSLRVDKGMSESEAWLPEGSALRARKADVSDAETWRASSVGATVSVRFLFRWSSFAAGIGVRDRLQCDGATYEITGGPREVQGRRRWLEITCTTRNTQ